MKERMDVLEEQLTIVHDGHFKDGPFSFKGSHYTIEDLTSRPLPIQRPHPPLILGGNAGPRAARLAARFADEYNTVMPTLDEVRERRANIAAACEKAGREPIPFSVMTTAVIGADEAEYDERMRELEAWTGGRNENPETMILGTVERVVARLEGLRRGGRRADLPPAPRAPRHRDGRADRARDRAGGGVMADDDDWVGEPPEGRHSRDRANPGFWANQWQGRARSRAA